MTTKRLLGVVVFLAVLSFVAAAASSCGGGHEDAVGLTEIEVIRDVVAQSGHVATGFEISDYLISEDGEWAGAMIRGADLVSTAVLLLRSGLKGWQVMDLGTGLAYQDILDQGAPDEIATFLTCFT
jgi:hypothetical protein